MTDGVDALLDRWHVVAEGSVVRTATSRLVLGRRGDRAVVLKVAPDEEERRGARLLEWWAGRGAVRVLARAGDAVLLERLAGPRDLAAMSAAGEDDAAARVLAETAVRLHANGVPTPRDAVGLLPLDRWFAALTQRTHVDPLLVRCAAVADRLLAGTTDADVVALHGDLHHGNVLDAGDEWLAIDPKGLVGHRAFDLANALVNPDDRAVERLDRRLPVAARAAGLDEAVLRDWTAAWCGLSLARAADDEPTWHARSCRAVAGRLLAD